MATSFTPSPQLLDAKTAEVLGQTYMDQFIEATKHGKLPVQQSEHLPTINYNLVPNIISAPRNDPTNNWRDYLCVQKLDPYAKEPTKGSSRAAGYDLFPFEAGTVPAWGKAVVGTKIKITVPKGYYGRIASRSGLSAKHDLEVGAGVIDEDYQGEIIVILRNHSDTAYAYTRNQAVAQFILERCLITPIKLISNRSEIFNDPSKGYLDMLCVEKLDPYALVPSRKSDDAAGCDIFPFESGVVPAWGKAKIGTKLKFNIPTGVYARIAPLTNLATDHDIEVGAGVIDEDYQGEIMIILRNHSDVAFSYNRETAIAQVILQQILIAPCKNIANQTEIFGATERGANGFGSTDKKN